MSKPNRNEIERNLLRTDHPLKDWRTQLSVLGWAFLKSSSAQYDDNAGVADFRGGSCGFEADNMSGDAGKHAEETENLGGVEAAGIDKKWHRSSRNG